MVDKMVGYESEPCLEGTSWYRMATGVGAHQKVGDSPRIFEETCQTIRDILLAHGYTQVDTLYERSGFASPSKVTAAINKGRTFLTFRGHGSETGWYGGAEGGYITIYQTSDVNALTNGGKLPVVIAPTCLANNYKHSSRCMGETFVNQDQGAVGYFGATNVSFSFWNDSLAIGIYRGIFEQDIKNFQAACDYGKQYMRTYFGSGDLTETEYYLMNILGDPELKIWTEAPPRFEWGPDTRLTSNPAWSWGQKVATDYGWVHVVWSDKRDGNYEIYYKHSTDGGDSWDSDMRLTANSAVSRSPSIATGGGYGRVHVVWVDRREGDFGIYYKHSTNGGISWGSDIRLSHNITDSESPSIATGPGSRVHVVWDDYRYIYYRLSTDGGDSWGTETILTNDPGESCQPSIATDDSGRVHLVWFDSRDNDYEIYYKRSTDGGNSWGPDVRLTHNVIAESWYPCIATDGSNGVYVVWEDRRDGNSEIYYKCSTDGGKTWGEDIRLTNDAVNSWDPRIAADNSGRVHLVWDDNRAGDLNFEIYYKCSPDQGDSWDPDVRLTADDSISVFPSIAIDNSGKLKIHVVWRDNRDGNDEIYYKKGGKDIEVNVEEEPTPLPIPQEFNLAQNYPNPFNSRTLIEYALPRAGRVKLSIFNILGQKIKTLVNGDQKVGSHWAYWDGRNDKGQPVSSGIYLYQLKVDGYTKTKKLILLK